MRDIYAVTKTSCRLDPDNKAHYVQVEGLDEEFIATSYDFTDHASCKATMDRVTEMAINRQEIIEQQESDLIQFQMEIQDLTDRLAFAESYARSKDDEIQAWRAESAERAKEVKQLFRIPNDEEGQQVIDYLRRHVQPGKQVILRGRDPLPGKRGYASTPLKDSQTLGVYVQDKK